MNKAITYCRVSTEEQAQENHHSLDAQKRICNDFAIRENYQIIRIFEDAGKSGTTIAGRPALKELQAFIEEQKDVTAVLIQDTDRIARNTSDHLAIKALLKKYGTKLISVSQPNIDDSAEGNLIDTIIASINQFQSELTGRKTQKGLEQKALKGEFPSFAPPGYLNIGDDDGKRRIIFNEAQAPLIKEAFDLYINGMSVEDIGELLYRKGLRTKRGKRLHTSKMFWALQNPFYYGAFRWGGKIYPGIHEPLVSQETWNLAQQVRAAKILNKSYDRKHNFLLAGFVFCSCGRKLTAEHHFKHSKGNRSSREYSYYHCTKGRKCTESRNIPAGDLEEQAEEKFKEVQFSNEFYKKLLVRLKKYHDNFKDEIEKETAQIKKRKSDVEKRRDNLEELLFNKIVNEEVYKRRAEQFDLEIKNFDEEIIKLSRRKVIQIDSFNEVVEFSKSVYKIYKTGEYKSKRQLLSFFWEKLIISDKQIIEAVPTLLFRTLQKLQKPPKKEVLDTENKQSFSNLKGDFINHPELGEIRESNP